ncbi:MAG: hypothetical protein IT223_12865, partial [Crocinitomicaceae bacterium]|nr:hypothetical protein [Crocinitomicaceae bacterium]
MKRIILVFSKKIFICIISAIAVISSFAQNDNNPLVFMHSDGVYLRWKGYREIDLSGYRVYRKEQGEVEWTQLTAAPLRMATTTKEINDLLGYKSELYFSLFEKKPGETIQPADFGRWKNEKDRILFEVTCLVNPEFGLALGEIFKDATAVIGKRYQYK